jgi:hypothetical protein
MQLEGAGTGKSVAGAGMLLLEGVVGSILLVAVGWHMVPAHSRWLLSEASEPQYMTWVIARHA